MNSGDNNSVVNDDGRSGASSVKTIDGRSEASPIRIVDVVSKRLENAALGTIIYDVDGVHQDHHPATTNAQFTNDHITGVYSCTKDNAFTMPHRPLLVHVPVEFLGAGNKIVQGMVDSGADLLQL